MLEDPDVDPLVDAVVDPLVEAWADVPLVLAALAACEGNLSAIARALAIDRNTLKRKLDKHGLRSVGP